MIEIWKSIEDFPDYEISNLGRVKSFKGIKERILKPGINGKDGYLFVYLYKNKSRYRKYIHRIVLENFEPVIDMNFLEGNHKDGVKLNNSLYNLEWLTHSENEKHAHRTGLKCVDRSPKNRGEKNINAKLNKDDIIKIKNYLRSKMKQCDIANIFNVSDTTISDIKHNKIWTYV